MPHDLLALATVYQQNIPDRILDYLHARGITDEVIRLHRLGWNGQRITIPITNRDGTIVCFKFAKDPDDPTRGPKMLSSRGGSLELYGWERVLAKPCRLIICEGEFDRLVLEAHGFAAVTSTGGAGSFRQEWAADFQSIPELYLCFDHDDAGRAGARRVGQLLPHARIVQLPDAVGPGGDITDFFVRLGRTREDFLQLLDTATPVPVPPPSLPVAAPAGWSRPFSELSWRIAEVKQAVPIADLVSRYLPLRPSGTALRGRCPFHEDHNPSLMVHPETRRFRCYGCGRHGDVITFLIGIEHLPFIQAIEWLERFRDDYDRPTREAA
jgi:DNA primase